MSLRLPDGPLLAFYGDDFTGSTEAMEVMAFAGLATVLFVRPPTPERLARFSDRRGIGIAGIARSKPPAWMDEHLGPAFDTLFALGAPITQYKVCSTFDSAPHVGSIGRAIDIALPKASERWSPMVVGAPQLRRWQAFGNLFAGVGDRRYRLDRHPTMPRHPITPMAEADLTRHLANTTERSIGLVDIIDVAGGQGDAALIRTRSAAEIVLFDVLDSASQAEVGRLIWENRGRGLFSASSSGLQYALVAYWRASGLLPEAPPLPAMRPVDRILVVSGSCSPGTADQIAAAETAGFYCHRLDGPRIADPSTRRAAIEDVLERLGDELRRGTSVVVYTARSPDDPAIEALNGFCSSAGLGIDTAQEMLGDALGKIAAALIELQALRRVLVAGGDTSGRVLANLPVDALEAASPFVPGSPVCRAHSEDPAFDGLELILKGGQVGGPELFSQATA